MENISVKDNEIVEETVKDNKKSRVIYFDILNILACICVVFLHCLLLGSTNICNVIWCNSFRI